ncbi:gamma carbonic anhydrase family protein [Wolbachia endosymbiont of Pentidionis agamae]|uniref:gamma carbonic anhydrase family protein n=1 Tax=Wolbachia endosymbiont of Pentidionis agamae TaxID=3110435 RepID=UPI002FD56F6A
MYYILKYQNYEPQIDNSVFIAGGTYVIGRVTIEKDSSVWYNCVLRGDVGSIKIGSGTNIQDGTIIHVDRNPGGDTVIGNMVTVGHSCVLHACKIHDKALIGMSSTIMDNAIIETESMVAAGSLVTNNKIVRSGEIWAGRPAKFFKKVPQIDHITKSSENYIMLMKEYPLSR